MKDKTTPGVTNKKCFKIAQHKRAFDIGYGITNVIKTIVGVIGIASLIEGNVIFIAFLGVSYLIFCYLFGWFWLKSGMFQAEIEVYNYHNAFVYEMRKVFKRK